jgi:hypothetical protein
VRWTFGAEPSPQTERAADLLRRVTNLVLALEDDEPALERLVVDLERAEGDLAARASAELAPRVGERAAGEGRLYLDHARDIGAFDPCFPSYDIDVDGDRATGTVTFPIAYEGPPDVVHGGFVALLFDCVVQHHNCDVGVAGKTRSMTIRYRRPAPLRSALTFTVDRSAGDDRITSTCQLLDGDRLLCEAVVEAVASDRSRLPEVSPRRRTP